MNIVKDIAKDFLETATQDETLMLLESAIPDLIEEFIFNPFYYTSSDQHSIPTNDRVDMRINNFAKIFSKTMSNTLGDKEVVDIRMFMSYRWIKFKETTLISKDNSSNIPIRFLLYRNLNLSILDFCSSSLSYDYIPTEMITNEKYSNLKSSEFTNDLAYIIVNDENYGLPKYFRIFNNILDKFITAILTNQDTNIIVRLVSFLLSDKSTGLSIMDIYNESLPNRNLISKVILGNHDQPKELTVKELANKILDGDLNQRTYECLIYLIGIKFILLVRNLKLSNIS